MAIPSNNASLKMKDCVAFHMFSSLTQFVDHADSITHCNFKGGEKQSNTGSKSFTGTADYAEASKLVRHGWLEGVKSIADSLNVIGNGKDSYSQHDAEMDVMGGYCMIGYYLGGDPECMWNPDLEDHRPVINVLVELSTNCGSTTSQIINRGAAILRLCQMIENSGKRVSIIGSMFTRASGTWHGCMITLKAPQDDFDLHSLAYALVHPSMLRRHEFRLIEGIAKPHAEHYSGGYGSACGADAIADLAGSISDIDLYMPVLGRDGREDYDEPEQAMRTVLKIAKDQGVIAE